MSINPSFSGEVQFRRYSDTSTQGQQVVFAVQDREALESFIGKEGKRFMAVLVELGDDEQPVQVIPLKSKELKPRAGDLCRVAGIWCKDENFWDFINTTFSGHDAIESEEDAADLIRYLCAVESRRELDSEPAKQLFLRYFQEPFHQWNKDKGLA